MACHIQIDMSDEFSKWLPISKYSIYRCGCWSRRKFLSVLWEDVGRRGGYYWQLRFKHSLSTKFKFTWKISWYREQYVLKTIYFQALPKLYLSPSRPQFGQGGPFIWMPKSTLRRISQSQIPMVMTIMEMMIMTCSPIHI